MSGPSQPSRALCLSGGGFRATLFHLGAIRRLNELGLLATCDALVSVSGGSILNGLLYARLPAMAVHNGSYQDFDQLIATPIRDFCAIDLRTPALLGSRLNPFMLARNLRDGFSVNAAQLVPAYDRLYRNVDLGLSEASHRAVPRFIFCATNMQTGSCWQMHGGSAVCMGDMYQGYLHGWNIRLSQAVAASSGFPPGFAPLVLTVPAGRLLGRTDYWGQTRVMPAKRSHGYDPNRIYLTDGGVYDNLGVEPIWKSDAEVFASDAGMPFAPRNSSSPWMFARLSRCMSISMEQVGAVRRRWLIERYEAGKTRGALWMINTDPAQVTPQSYDPEVRGLLAAVRTDLDGFSDGEIACLENHGYATVDDVIHRRCASVPNTAPFQWPHPQFGPAHKQAAVEALRTSHQRRWIRDVARYAGNPFARRRRG